MKQVGYYNGNWGDLEKMTVPMCDRACYFGDGVYDAAYAVGGTVFALDEHIDRFMRGCLSVGMLLTYGKENLRDLLMHGVGLCDEKDLFVYFQASCGIGIRKHEERNLVPSLWIMIYPKKIAPAERILRLITVPDTRYDLCNVKTLNLMPNVLAAQKAARADCDEAVFIRGGEVCECAHSNIQILHKNRLISPPPSPCTLGGLGRKHLVAVCRGMGVAVEERRFSQEELFSADEVIVTSAGFPCLQANVVDGKAVGGKAQSLLKKIQKGVYAEYDGL